MRSKRSKQLKEQLPELDLHELVTLYWKGQTLPTWIKARNYDPDMGCWLYELGGQESLGLVPSAARSVENRELRD